MFRSLTVKLTFAFILVAFTTAGLVGLFIRLTSQDRFTQFLIDQQRSRIEQVLAEYYSTNGSWSGIAAAWDVIEISSMPSNNPPPPDNNPGVHTPQDQRRSLFGLADPSGLVIVSVDPSYPAGTLLTSQMLASGQTIKVNGQTVGVLLTARQISQFRPAESRFLRTDEALLYSAWRHWW